MSQVVLIDDVRSFRDRRECLVARTAAYGVALLQTLYVSKQRIDELWLDHDLGRDDTIWPVVRLLEDAALAGRVWDIGVVKIHAARSGPAHRMGISLRRAGYATDRVVDLRVFRVRRATGDAWQAEGDEGWESIHAQLFAASEGDSAFIQWKKGSTGATIARRYSARRNAARAEWCSTHGEQPDAWPLGHPPVLLRLPDALLVACVRCDWVDSRPRSISEARTSAETHASAAQDSDTAANALVALLARVWT
ncbi:MAG: hypothetical protein JWM02_1427 [Frankiales bacterium]|nr:hypothetical protein [Frankiales bacterium]